MTPITASPVAVSTSAIRVHRPGPSRSGIRAPTLRITTTIPENSPSTSPAPPIPRSSAYSGTNVRNPAIPQIVAASTRPGSSPAGWINRCRSGASLSAGVIEGSSSASPTAMTARTIAPTQTALKPRCSIRVSLMNGPAPRPMYSASEAKLNASPRRSGGARSTFAASAATKNSASPAPVSSRNATSTSTEVAMR